MVSLASGAREGAFEGDVPRFTAAPQAAKAVLAAPYGLCGPRKAFVVFRGAARRARGAAVTPGGRQPAQGPLFTEAAEVRQASKAGKAACGRGRPAARPAARSPAGTFRSCLGLPPGFGFRGPQAAHGPQAPASKGTRQAKPPAAERERGESRRRSGYSGRGPFDRQRMRRTAVRPRAVVCGGFRRRGLRRGGEGQAAWRQPHLAAPARSAEACGLRGFLKGGLTDMEKRGPETRSRLSVRLGRAAPFKGRKWKRLKCGGHSSLQVTDRLLPEEQAFRLQTREGRPRPRASPKPARKGPSEG